MVTGLLFRTNSKLKYILGGGMAFLLLFYAIACAYLQRVAIASGVFFLLFEGICIFAVGAVVLSLFQVANFSFFECIIFSYALGYSTNILVYLISFPILGRYGVIILSWALGVASLLIISKRIPDHYKDLECKLSELFIVIFTFVAILVIHFLVGPANNASPLVLEKNTYYTDLFYWMADAVSFTKRFPAVNYRHITAANYYYHYFSSIQLAVVSLCTGIEVVNLGLAFSVMQSAMFLSLSVFVFIRFFSKSMLALIVGVLFTLFTTGYEMQAMVTSVSHYFTAPFGFDIGISYGLLTLLSVIKQIQIERFNWRVFLIAGIMFITCVGVKAPVALMIMGVVGVQCLYWLYKKNFRCALIYGGAFLGLFVVLYFFIVNGLPTTGMSKTTYFLNNGANKLSIIQLLDIREQLISKFSLVPGEIIFDVYYFYLIRPSVFVFFFVALLIKVIRLKTIDSIDLGFALITIMGVCMTRYLKMVGYSQMYFAMTVIPLAVAFSVSTIEEIFEEHKIRLPLLRFGVRFVTGIFVFAMFLFGFNMFINSNFLAPQVNSGVGKLLWLADQPVERKFLLEYDGVVRNTDYDDNSNNTYLKISKQLYQACMWLNQTAPPNAIVATNAIEPVEKRYSVGVICDCWFWDDPDGILLDVLSGDDSAVERYIEVGVRYLIVNKGTADGLVQSSGSAHLLLDNFEVQIIELYN